MKNKNVNLGEGSVGKLLINLAVPAIIAQMVNLLYNIVDRIFIGRMVNGEIAMAGIGVAMPIIMIISAFSYLIGSGGAPLTAIKMGEKNNDDAEKIMSNSFSMLLIVGVSLTIIFLLFKEPILWAFGASETTINYALDYLTIYVMGTLFVQIALGMNTFINTQGFAKIGMFTVLIGAVINIVLDPILIFTFDMGVKGAALASIIAQGVSTLFALNFLFGKKSILKIRKKYLKLDKKIVGSILALGIAPFIMQATESLVLVSLNNQLSRFGGDLAIGVMTIMSSIMQIILLPANGLTQGAQPIISYNYGAKNIDRVKKTFKYTVLATLSYTFFMCLILMIAPEMVVKIFNNDPSLLEITSWSIKIYFAGIFIFGIQAACQSTFLALGQAKISLFLALLRKIILLVPLIFILPIIMEEKLFAVLLAEPVADVTAVLITSICFTVFYKKTLNVMDKNENKFVENEKPSIN